MLHPRDDGDQRVLESELVITPGPSQLSRTRDSHGNGNHVATAHFADQASELRFESKFHLDHAPAASERPISRILPAFIRLPTPPMTGPA